MQLVLAWHFSELFFYDLPDGFRTTALVEAGLSGLKVSYESEYRVYADLQL